MALSKRTRGKTQPRRLRLFDEWLSANFPSQMTEYPWAVDVGFGEVADTAVEFHEMLCARGESWQLLATDMDTNRVKNAADQCERVDRVFAVQDFHLEKLAELQAKTRNIVRSSAQSDDVQVAHVPSGAMLIRAFNVLRQYPPKECAAVHEALGLNLQEGGWLIDGTSDRGGDLLSFHVFSRRNGRLERVALIFSCSGQRAFGPWQFRDVLPQDVRRSVRSNTALWKLFTLWEECAGKARKASSRRRGNVTNSELNLRIFEDSVDFLREEHWDVRFCPLISGAAMVVCTSKEPLASAFLPASKGSPLACVPSR